MNKLYDVVVVGAGVLGSFCALQLRMRGYNCLLCDQASLGHSLGSSHGESRVIRAVYPDLHHTLLMREAYSSWSRLENQSKRSLLVPTGSLELAPASSVAGSAVRAVAQQAREPIVHISTSDAFHRWGVRVPATYSAWYFKRSGVLRARQCVAAVHATYLAAGGDVLEDVHLENMTRIQDNNHELTFSVPPGVGMTPPDSRPSTSTGFMSIRARAVVLSPGAWLGELTHKLFGLALPIVPWKVHVHYVPLRRRASEGLGSPGLRGSLGTPLGATVAPGKHVHDTSSERLHMQPVIVDYGGTYLESEDKVAAASDRTRSVASAGTDLEDKEKTQAGDDVFASADTSADLESGVSWAPPHPIYAIPPLEKPDQMKVAAHVGVPVSEMGKHSWAPEAKAFAGDSLDKWCESRIASLLDLDTRTLTPKPVSTESCLYSMTPDETFIVGPLPVAGKAPSGAAELHAGSTGTIRGSPKEPTEEYLDPSRWETSIILLGGGSGHAFKLAPVLGRMAADYVEGFLHAQGGPVSVPGGAGVFLKWL